MNRQLSKLRVQLPALPLRRVKVNLITSLRFCESLISEAIVQKEIAYIQSNSVFFTGLNNNLKL
jgi:hypothetical protein